MFKLRILPIKIFYINFLEKKKRNILELIFYFFLYLLSVIYSLIIKVKNFLYDFKIKKPHLTEKIVISVGGISWGGCGKTTLTNYLYKKLSGNFKVAILRRGYGEDETKLLLEKTNDVYCSPNRIRLLKDLSNFDIFILDDGFQYRKLYRNIDIVVMADRELKRKIRLMPASFFREDLNSLKRAHFLILNHIEGIEEPQKIKEYFLSKFPHLKIYFSRYKFNKFVDLYNNEIKVDFLYSKKIAVFTAIGYPESFLNKIRELNLDVAGIFIYPDHYVLNDEEFIDIENKLLKENINYLIITHKDRFHIPKIRTKINVIILEVEFCIEDEEKFLEEIFNKITITRCII